MRPQRERSEEGIAPYGKYNTPSPLKAAAWRSVFQEPRKKGATDMNENENLENTELTEEEQEELEKSRKTAKKEEKLLRHWQTFLLRLVVLILIIWVIFFLLLGLIVMPNGDMYPRIDAGDLLLFYRLDKDVKSQDVIVFTKNGTRYVGRVVAAGGETVDIPETGGLVVNGNHVQEPNIFYSTLSYEGYTEYPVTLGEDECFVLSDYRRGAEDSRYFGPVSKKDIAGTVITVLRRDRL